MEIKVKIVVKEGIEIELSEDEVRELRRKLDVLTDRHTEYYPVYPWYWGQPSYLTSVWDPTLTTRPEWDTITTTPSCDGEYRIVNLQAVGEN